ncbi:fshr-1, partial [Pristionchus pacificus]
FQIDSKIARQLNGMGSWLLRLALLFLLQDFTPCSSQRSDAAFHIMATINRKSCPLSNETETCKCITRVRKEIEAECCCIGDSVRAIPHNMTANLRSLMLVKTGINEIKVNDFKRYEFLEELEIISAPLKSFDYASLANHTRLTKLIIKNCDSLTEVKGTLMLPHLKIRKIDLRFNALRTLPIFEMTSAHKVDAEVDLSANDIEAIPTGRLRNLRLRSFKVNDNALRRIEAEAFVNSSIHIIEISSNNDLTYISPDAFAHITVLNSLDLSHTSISSLPFAGMETVRTLILKAVESLKQLPSVLAFTSLKKAVFTYPHHCCLFKHVSKLDLVGNETREYRKRICKKRMEDEKKDRLKENHVKQNRKKRSLNGTESILQLLRFDWPDEPEEDSSELPPFGDDELGASRCLEVEELASIREHYDDVKCTPEPDAMNPCESIVGYPVLRYAIWFFWISSVILNLIVWFILAMAYEARKRSHYIFMFNLSFANALSAIYLGLLALEDKDTQDEYFRFAVGWQTGVWCRTAGFLCVFSSSLSILSMFFIAFEIAYSTRQAIFGRHLSFRTCMVCVVFSYVFSFVMATLPLVGVSDYTTTSTCLPLFVEDHIDRFYIIFGLSILIIAFIGMVICYGMIFKILMDPNTPSRPEDHHIIMKMLALIITDMLCWMPSCILGLSAALGYPLIDISTAKIFIICFFPLNTFTNPFLYVFLTKVIRSKVKKRAVPIFKRLVNTPRHTIHSLSALYHMHGPDDRRRKSNDSAKLMSVNQNSNSQHSPHPQYQDTTTTKSSWLNGEASGTPRGSDSAESTALLGLPEGWDRNRRRSTPRVSFQSVDTGFGTDCECTHQKPEKPSRFSSILKKVSAIPEVSDLSEHSSDSHHEHVITMLRSPRLLHDKRVQTTSLCNHSDSGRSSLASIFARSEYSSAASDCSDTSSSSLLHPLSIDTSVDDDETPPATRKVCVSERKIVIGLGAI